MIGDQLPWDLKEGAWANCVMCEFIQKLYNVVKRALHKNHTEEKNIYEEHTTLGKFGTLIGDL